MDLKTVQFLMNVFSLRAKTQTPWPFASIQVEKFWFALDLLPFEGPPSFYVQSQLVFKHNVK